MAEVLQTTQEIVRFGMPPEQSNLLHLRGHEQARAQIDPPSSATDSTRKLIAIHHASSHTDVTNVEVTTQAADALITQHLAFDPDNAINATNPLPCEVTATVNIPAISALAENFPNKNLCTYILEGLRIGFKTGYRGPMTVTRPKNLRSATNNKRKVSEAINKEIKRKHTSGPFKQPPFSQLHCSPIGSADKPDGSIRLVMDLSQPEGSSINEWIDKDEFSVHYTHFDEATKLVRMAGEGCFMCKVDIKHAFRLLPVHPSEWNLLGYIWEDSYFVDTRLPFGLRSSSRIFNDFADLVCWIAQNKYNLINLVHYSDDYFLVCEHSLMLAREQLKTLCQAFEDMGIPLAEDKIIGPSTCIIYLGIGINSMKLTMYIAKDKYNEIRMILKTWKRCKKCTREELESLIGKLNFISKVVQPGRLFLRRLINLTTTVKKSHHHINLNNQARADIEWWHQFLPAWSQSTIIPQNYTTYPSDLRLSSDACDIGFGAIYGYSWIQGKFSNQTLYHSIDFKELFAIVAAVSTWGYAWTGKRIVFYTDNKPITDIWQSGSTPSPDIMCLARKLYLLAAEYQFCISLKHISGTHNEIADAISRFQMSRLQKLCPGADHHSTDIPSEIWQLLETIPVPKTKKTARSFMN